MQAAGDRASLQHGCCAPALSPVGVMGRHRCQPSPRMLYPRYRPPAAQTANSTRYLQGLTFAGGTTIDEEGHKPTAPRSSAGPLANANYQSASRGRSPPLPTVCGATIAHAAGQVVPGDASVAYDVNFALNENEPFDGVGIVCFDT